MNELVNGLSRITVLRAPRMEYPSYYYEHGFMVRFKRIPQEMIQEANIMDMKKKFLATTSESIFNQTAVEIVKEGNPERRQLVTKNYNQMKRDIFTDAQQALLVKCEEEVLKITKELLPNIRRFKTIESLLYSRARSRNRQKLHRDLRGYDDDAALALIAFEPNTRLIMCRGSHISENVGEIGVDNIPAIYELGVGDILIFHPSLIHAGDRYIRSNLRLHYYVISSKRRYKPNTTYPADPVVRAALSTLVRNANNSNRRLDGAQISRENEEAKNNKRRINLAAARCAKKNRSSE